MSNASLARGVGNKRRRSSEILERHRQVADAITTGASESDALRAGGYHPSSGQNAMRTEAIQLALEEAREEIVNVTTLKRLDVLNMFLEAITMARTLADPAQMINGADKIAKMMGYYAPETKRIELSTTESSLQAKFQQMTDQELLELASGRAKVIDGEVLQ